jgi:hypothetical protein
MTNFRAAQNDVKICGSLRANEDVKFMRAYGEINAAN